MGFEKGWGDTAERVRETMHTLSELMQAPDPQKLEIFISRLPIIFNVVIFSPHGYFGQQDVLGLPDTGGQVRNMFDPTSSFFVKIFTRMIYIRKRWFTFWTK